MVQLLYQVQLLHKFLVLLNFMLLQVQVVEEVSKEDRVFQVVLVVV